MLREKYDMITQKAGLDPHYDRMSVSRTAKSVDNNPIFVIIINIETSHGIHIQGISQHTFDRLAEPEVKIEDVYSALKNPRNVGEIIIDDHDRKSQRFIGETATVNINPDTGIIITV